MLQTSYIIFVSLGKMKETYKFRWYTDDNIIQSETGLVKKN